LGEEEREKAEEDEKRKHGCVSDLHTRDLSGFFR